MRLRPEAMPSQQQCRCLAGFGVHKTECQNLHKYRHEAPCDAAAWCNAPVWSTVLCDGLCGATSLQLAAHIVWPHVARIALYELAQQHCVLWTLRQHGIHCCVVCEVDLTTGTAIGQNERDHWCVCVAAHLHILMTAVLPSAEAAACHWLQCHYVTP